MCSVILSASHEKQVHITGQIVILRASPVLAGCCHTFREGLVVYYGVLTSQWVRYWIALGILVTSS